MPKHRSLAEQRGQTDVFDPSAGQKPTKPATALKEDLQMQLVLDALKASGKDGATRYELARKLGMLDNTVGPRLSDLRRHGLIRKTDALREGAIVWLPK